MTLYFSNVYIIASICALAGFLFGFDTGVIAGALIFINKSFSVSLFVQQFIVSSCILGAFLGALFSGRLADYYGRKIVLSYTAIAFVIGTIIATMAPNVEFIILGRFILGLAIGVSSYTAPLYVSEMSPKNIRGRLVTLNILAITAGEMIAHYINYVFVPMESWRLMFLTGLIPAVLLFIAMQFLPESPKYKLIKQDVNYIELISNKYKSIFFIGIFLGVMQQAIGINTIMYYGPMLFAEAGFDLVENQILATFLLAFVNLVFTMVTLAVIDYVGRRALLLTGISIASISMLTAAVILKLSYGEQNSLLVLSALVCFVSGYAISLGAIFWVMIAEIYPLKIRSTAMSIITAIQWMSNFIIAASFLSLIDYIGLSNVFMLYALLGVVAVIYCYKYVPETKNVSLDIIERNIEKYVPVRYIGR